MRSKFFDGIQVEYQGTTIIVRSEFKPENDLSYGFEFYLWGQYQNGLFKALHEQFKQISPSTTSAVHHLQLTNKARSPTPNTVKFRAEFHLSDVAKPTLMKIALKDQINSFIDGFDIR